MDGEEEEEEEELVACKKEEELVAREINYDVGGMQEGGEALNWRFVRECLDIRLSI